MKQKSVAVTAVAEVAVCERRVYLRAKLGERTTGEIERNKARGNELHQRAFNQKTPSTSDRRCFIATAVYGCDALETNRLRRFRDERLLTTWLGTKVVAGYYATSPAIASVAKRSEWVASCLRCVLNLILRVIK